MIQKTTKELYEAISLGIDQNLKQKSRWNSPWHVLSILTFVAAVIGDKIW